MAAVASEAVTHGEEMNFACRKEAARTVSNGHTDDGCNKFGTTPSSILPRRLRSTITALGDREEVECTTCFHERNGVGWHAKSEQTVEQIVAFLIRRKQTFANILHDFR